MATKKFSNNNPLERLATAQSSEPKEIPAVKAIPSEKKSKKEKKQLKDTEKIFMELKVSNFHQYRKM